jgi:predicted DNA-binding protein
MSGRGKKTVLRTVRLSKEMDDILEADAEHDGISESSLVNRIVKKYIEWDRHAEKFRFVSIGADTFRTILEKTDDRTLDDAFSDISGIFPEAIALFWFKTMSLDTVLKTVSLLGTYSGLFVNEIDYKDGSHVITLKHGLGKRWSTYVGKFIEQFIKKELDVVPVTRCADDMAIITFRVGLSRGGGSDVRSTSISNA